MIAASSSHKGLVFISPGYAALQTKKALQDEKEKNVYFINKNLI